MSSDSKKSNAADTGKVESLDKIITKPDSIFLKDKKTRLYLASKEFYVYKRSNGENYSEFIVKFEHCIIISLTMT